MSYIYWRAEQIIQMKNYKNALVDNPVLVVNKICTKVLLSISPLFPADC